MHYSSEMVSAKKKLKKNDAPSIIATKIKILYEILWMKEKVLGEVLESFFKVEKTLGETETPLVLQPRWWRIWRVHWQTKKARDKEANTLIAHL